jgi:hypothetical protein
LAYGRVDVRHGVLVVLVSHDRRSRSVRFDQKIRNISVITRNGAVSGNGPQNVNKQIIQMPFKGDVTHRRSRQMIDSRKRNAGYQGLANGASLQN